MNPSEGFDGVFFLRFFFTRKTTMIRCTDVRDNDVSQCNGAQLRTSSSNNSEHYGTMVSRGLRGAPSKGPPFYAQVFFFSLVMGLK